MKPGIELTRKPDAFCVTTIAGRGEGGGLTPIADVYDGPQEHGSSGPTFHCGFRWELCAGRSLTLLVWEHQTQSGYPTEEYKRLRIFTSADHGRTRKEAFSRYLDGALHRG